MPFPTEVRPCFYCYSYTLCLALFWKLNCLMMIWRDMSTESIMKIFNKIITIFLIQRHKCSSHNDKLYLIDIMPDFPKLLDSISCLNIWIIACSYSSHWCGLITCIRLRWILKVRIWASRTINTNISCGGDMRATMRLAHNSNNGNSTRSSNRLCLE